MNGSELMNENKVFGMGSYTGHTCDLTSECFKVNQCITQENLQICPKMTLNRHIGAKY